MVEINLISIGILIILVGFVLVFAGTIMQTKGKFKAEGGGIVFIGPFPVITGATSKEIFYVLLIASVILIVFWLASFLLH